MADNTMANFELDDGVSIIVPVYNGEKYIDNCIKMLLRQEGNYEIVLINDGSIDRTDEIIHNYLNNDRIQYYKGTNKGVSAARNKGLKLCKKKWVIFCDVDDEIAPGFISDILATVPRHRASDYICYGRFSLGNEDMTEIEKFDPVINISMIMSGKGIDNSSDYLMFSVWSKVFNKDFLISNDITFNENVVFSEDVLFMMSSAVKARNVAYIHRGYYRYVQNNDSTCHSAGTDKDYKGFLSYVDSMEELRLNNLELWSTTELNNNYYEHMNNCCMVALGRVRTGTRQKGLRQRKARIKTIGQILDRYEYRHLDFKSRAKRFIVKYFPTFYIIIGDFK